MLKEMKQLLQERAPLSLKELAAHFSVQPDTIRPMLQLLEDKQQIRSLRSGCGGGCAGCTCLSEESTLFFEPVTPAGATGPAPLPCSKPL